MSKTHDTARSCSVCHIRETGDYPFPSTYWDLCWNHYGAALRNATTRTFVLSGRRVSQVWDGLAWVTISDTADGAK